MDTVISVRLSQCLFCLLCVLSTASRDSEITHDSVTIRLNFLKTNSNKCTFITELMVTCDSVSCNPSHC